MYFINMDKIAQIRNRSLQLTKLREKLKKESDFGKACELLNISVADLKLALDILNILKEKKEDPLSLLCDLLDEL
jgi:hypothetical protein